MMRMPCYGENGGFWGNIFFVSLKDIIARNHLPTLLADTRVTSASRNLATCTHCSDFKVNTTERALSAKDRSVKIWAQLIFILVEMGMCYFVDHWLHHHRHQQPLQPYHHHHWKSFIEFGKKGNVFGFAVMKMDAQPQSIAEHNPMRMMMIRIVMIVKTTIFMLGKGSKPPVTEKLR